MDILGVSITESKPKSDTRQRSQSRRVRCRFTIEQRQFDRPTNSSTKDFMEMIANHFEVNLLTSTGKDSKLLSTSTYYFSVESKGKLHKVIDYFDTYSLMGTKYLDYEDFKIVYDSAGSALRASPL
jgi:LAGLIDADG endonuclease